MLGWATVLRYVVKSVKVVVSEIHIKIGRLCIKHVAL